MTYDEYLENKKVRVAESGFAISDDELNPQLFPFQKFCVKRALEQGKYALFEDCGLGKTFQQLEWADKVAKHTNKPVIIFAPLGVVGQTINEGKRFGYDVTAIEDTETNEPKNGIYITNYDNMEHIDASYFAGIVLDESSILKNFQGKTKQKLVDDYMNTPLAEICKSSMDGD